MSTYTVLPTRLGDLILIADETHLLGVYFAGQKHAPDLRGLGRRDRHPVLEHAAQELGEYLDGQRSTFTVPLRPQGTPFQRAIWAQIAGIGFGETISYGELARRAGMPSASRAAGAATGRNPLCIIVPCHRVVATDGALHGFAGGLERKRQLLEVEKPIPAIRQG